MYRKTLRINLFGIEPPVEEALRRAAPLDRFEHAVEAFPTVDGEAFCSCDIAVVNLRLFAGSPGGARPSRCLADLAARRRERLDTFYSAVAVVADAAEAARWTPEDYRVIDALWTGPLDGTRAAFELARLQRSAKRDADLALAQQYLDTAIDSIPELVWFKDAHGAHLKVNDAFCETVGKTKDQVEGRGHYYIWDITPDEYAQGEFVCLESEEETMRSNTTLLFDEQVKTRGGMRQFKTYKTPLIDYDGSVMGTVGVAHDVTDLGNIRTELEIFIDSMPYAVVVLDNEGAIVNINERAEDYFDVRRERVVGGNFDRWRRIVLGDAVVDANDFEDSSFFTASIRGESKTFEVNERAILDVFGNATGVLRIYRDVTNERKLEQRVIAAARTDYLTGLYNRRYFYEHVEEHRGNQPVTLITFDLDDFKNINDRYGHAAGDAALGMTAKMLQEAFPDGFVVRWGGDEFVVALMGERSTERTEATVRALLAELAHESAADGNAWAVTASAGIAATDDPGLPIDALIRKSDEALYRAKREGASPCVAGPDPA
ncbi:sensor domain-containing diguanylate cyclase [Gordonibacter urolithinfaciens]|uniref:Diguanylate cyclase n=1 Tax=Gordonibacter urolithinfaciens TaxID=1335613 RepID=A0A6N8IF74_9ACTN|nr:diguanylate cyclase [Gordonibacter urolithinfaciens]MVM54212.1 diguanylate cyclase [Gordonibacter urolithinfaciens]MVN14468.1 diguanylate cyclase [Gordonibacter urolithinfaciens]MVN37741.1 diguanylate cyclase [Gordonibacter urolithinfaciens]MVN56732.1 diguanylate cyclase [Gordonibacter urolithinfaciens]MVN62428.1 diguanylate cyclase [Gordonibacter urolithinfaciens]